MNVPRLRFKEYEGHWLPISIGNIGELITGSTPDTTETAYYNGNKLFVTPVDITSGRYVYETKTRLTEAGFRKGRLVKAYSVLFVCIGSTIGKVAQNRFDCITNQQINAITPSSNFSPEFVYSRLENDAKKISLLAGEQAVPIINKTSFSKVTIYVPELPEQTKIANFLTAIDEKITQLTQKYDLLVQFKKGVMQQIFSQKLRFKDEDGREFLEWEEKALNELLNVVIDNRGKTPPVECSGNPLLEVNAIGNKNINYKVVSKFVSDETYLNWFRKHIENGDVLFSTVGATAQCSYFQDEQTKAVIAQNIVGLRFKKIYNGQFMFYLLTEKKNNQKFKTIEMSAVQPSVKVSQMIYLFFSIPSLKEQTKIANFLTAIDDKITYTQNQLEAVKLYKKGLLQQMFV